MKIKGFRSYSMPKDSIPSEQAVTKLLYKAMWGYCSCPATYGAAYYAVLAVFAVLVPLAYAAGRYYNWTTTQEMKEKYKSLENAYGAQEIVLKTAQDEKKAEAEVFCIHHIEKIYHTQPRYRNRKKDEEGTLEADTKFHTQANCPGLNARKADEELVYRNICSFCDMRLKKGKTS